MACGTPDISTGSGLQTEKTRQKEDPGEAIPHAAARAPEPARWRRSRRGSGAAGKDRALGAGEEGQRRIEVGGQR